MRASGCSARVVDERADIRLILTPFQRGESETWMSLEFRSDPGCAFGTARHLVGQLRARDVATFHWCVRVPPGRPFAPMSVQVRSWRTYSKSMGRPLIPCLGALIQLAICL